MYVLFNMLFVIKKADNKELISSSEKKMQRKTKHG